MDTVSSTTTLQKQLFRLYQLPLGKFQLFEQLGYVQVQSLSNGLGIISQTAFGEFEREG